MNTEKTITLQEATPEQLQEMLHQKQSKEKAKKDKRIKKFNKDKDIFVATVVDTFTGFNEKLSELKNEIIKKANDFHQERYLMHGKEAPKQKQFTIFNTDKSMKVVTDYHQKFDFNEQADVAINSIREFFKSKFAKHSKLVYSLLDELLIKNKKGDYDPKLLTKLRSKVNEIDDPELNKAYTLLEDSKHVSGTALYCRVYKKDANQKFKEISIQFSSL